ncbi:MAG: endonuclease [Halobacteriovoraceae bacterium]|nr:endonuclease [Halobacteriovoraceae bacterium]|tara:strand:- start:87 stop:326 length:240 start_codon:yes stop_codon:yes gene_type:complete
MWFVYLIDSKKGVYTGITNNLIRRYYQHQGKIKGGAKFFRGNRPYIVLGYEIFLNKSDALKREIQIKKLSREKKRQIFE